MSARLISAVPLQDDSSNEIGTTNTNSNTNNKHNSNANNKHNNKHNNSHLKTYTAGEDQSRLAAMAKELGLQNQRQPRKQVRAPAARTNQSIIGTAITQFVTDSTFEDARMRAVYSSHTRLEEEDDLMGTNAVLGRMHASWAAQDFDDLGDLLEADEEITTAEDPHAAGLGGSLTSAILAIFKGMVGPAILYLPHGFAGAGYAIAIPIMLVSTAMFLYSSRCLLDAWKHESTKESSATSNTELSSLLSSAKQNNHNRKHRRVILSYPELAYRALGSTGETVVKTGIALMQSGVCLTYLIFVPQNLHASLLILTGTNVAPEFWLLLMIAIQIPLSWIRDIRKLTPTNFVANALILYGLLLCLGFAFVQACKNDQGMGPLEIIGNRLSNLDPFNANWFLFIGTSVLLFEGSITLLVPLQEAVHSEKEREQFPKVYETAILSIIGFYAFFGITCWMAFGNDVHTVLTTSLPETVLSTTVQLAYSLAVVLTFPLQNFPALEIACKSIGNLIPSGNNCCKPHIKRNIISSFLVVALALVAVCLMESLDKVVSLMGSLLGCPIAFVFPPLIHSQLCTLSPARQWGNRIVIVLGLVAMVLASITTLAQW